MAATVLDGFARLLDLEAIGDALGDNASETILFGHGTPTEFSGHAHGAITALVCTSHAVWFYSCQNGCELAPAAARAWGNRTIAFNDVILLPPAAIAELASIAERAICAALSSGQLGSQSMRQYLRAAAEAVRDDPAATQSELWAAMAAMGHTLYLVAS